MIARYTNKEIAEISADLYKLTLWQVVELAVIKARVLLEEIPLTIYTEIEGHLKDNPIDVNWWKDRDKEINHDLNAFLDERLRFIPVHLQQYFHKEMTSYDTEEAAFVIMLTRSLMVAKFSHRAMKRTLAKLARKYRYTIMAGRTHGQEAELQSFGKRCLTWLAALNISYSNLMLVSRTLQFSRIAGALGNFGQMNPKVAGKALEILGLKQFYGSTQIMPREAYQPIANALCQLNLTIVKIAKDVRLGARSGNVIYREPFKRKQKGSSAMPHKRNPIMCENTEGMGRLAIGYSLPILLNITTDEERDIAQSSVERNAWPDLFHTVIRVQTVMTKVLKGLVVYPENMLLEIRGTRGCYASAEVKDWLKKHGVPYGLTAEEVYRIVQLASFNVFASVNNRDWLLAGSLAEADSQLARVMVKPAPEYVSIQQLILEAGLAHTKELDVSKNNVKRWNKILEKIFSELGALDDWNRMFLPSHLLRHEAVLYKEILGE